MPHHTLKKVKENIKDNRISKAVNVIYTWGKLVEVWAWFKVVQKIL